MFKITTQNPDNSRQIEALLDQVFGTDRHNKISYGYRRSQAAVADLCFVALEDDLVVGTLRFWPVQIGAASAPALLLGPIGVAPERQKTGIGRALMSRGHWVAQALGYKIVLLVGEVNYYCRFGYFPAADFDISMPGEAPERTLVHELVAGSLNGVSGKLVQPAGKVAAGSVA